MEIILKRTFDILPYSMSVSINGNEFKLKNNKTKTIYIPLQDNQKTNIEVSVNNYFFARKEIELKESDTITIKHKFMSFVIIGLIVLVLLLMPIWFNWFEKFESILIGAYITWIFLFPITSFTLRYRYRTDFFKISVSHAKT